MDFLARKPNPYVPTYSLPAIADKSNISKALANTAPIIPAFDRDHDGQLTRDDAIVPGSKLLGATTLPWLWSLGTIPSEHPAPSRASYNLIS